MLIFKLGRTRFGNPAAEVVSSWLQTGLDSTLDAQEKSACRGRQRGNTFDVMKTLIGATSQLTLGANMSRCLTLHWVTSQSLGASMFHALERMPWNRPQGHSSGTFNETQHCQRKRENCMQTKPHSMHLGGQPSKFHLEVFAFNIYPMPQYSMHEVARSLASAMTWRAADSQIAVSSYWDSSVQRTHTISTGTSLMQSTEGASLKQCTQNNACKAVHTQTPTPTHVHTQNTQTRACLSSGYNTTVMIIEAWTEGTHTARTEGTHMARTEFMVNR